MTWGIVRFGRRYALLRRLGGGLYEAEPYLRQYGGRMLHGPLEDVLPAARSFRTEDEARRVAQRLQRTVDPQDGRWVDLDRG